MENNMPQDGMLTMEQTAEICRCFSGKLASGLSASILNFQCFDGKDIRSKEVGERIYQLPSAVLDIAPSSAYPGFFSVDVSFQSSNAPELRMLWLHLQRFRTALKDNPDSEPIFYLSALASDTVSRTGEENDALLLAHICNPVMAFLTRSEPTVEASDEEGKLDGIRQGGNVVRMLVPNEFVRFEATNEIDTREAKSEVQNEIYEEEYALNAADKAPFTDDSNL